MNKEKYFEHSVRENCFTNREVLEKIYKNALLNRPVSEVSYRPLTFHPNIDMIFRQGADFALFYPNFEEGDYAYVSSCMDGLFERNMAIHTRECETAEIYFNSEKCVERECVKDSEYYYPVNFKKGQNKLIIKVTATNDSFKVFVEPKIPELRMFPGDYVYSSWQYIEKDGFFGQQGVEVSRLYKKGEEAPEIDYDKIDWVFPVKPEQSNVKKFDFNKLCKKGKTAYAYTYIKGKISINHNSPMKIFENGEEIYSENTGNFSREYKENTPILIKSNEYNGVWGFNATTKGTHSMPFVYGATVPDLQWMWIGGFGRDSDDSEDVFPPEINLQFSEPYATVNGPVYWRFYRENTHLKQYMHSIFYGQWFYPLMVGLYGLKQAAHKLGKKEFSEYFLNWLKLLCNHRGFAVFDKAQRGWSNYLVKSVPLDDLDSIGTIGINMVEAYMMTYNDEFRYMAQLLADRLAYNVPRFPDGTFNRRKTMWTDDLYMCLPFMARLGAMTGEKRYFDDIAVQVRGFFGRMFMEEEGLLSHILFVDKNALNRVPWGRGNGWGLLALSEVLILMPEEHEEYEFVMETYRRFASGVLRHRDREKGMWHQVVNNPRSYLETSGSAMFITALARGVRLGWIDENYKDDVNEAWEALLNKCVDSDGNVYGVCKGSGCNMEEKYYLNLDTIVNDDHGVGIVMGACCEVMEMLGE